MSRPIRLPPAMRSRPFSVTEAVSTGVSRRQLRRGDLSTPFWGVRSLAPPSSTLDLARAYSTRMRNDAVFSHETAAALWGIWFPRGRRHPSAIDVTVPSGTHAPGGRGVRGHRGRLAAKDVDEVAGLPVTSLARTWADLGALWGMEDMVAAGDNVTWFRRPSGQRASIGDLRDALSRSAGARGSTTLASAFPFVCGRADSHPESCIRFRLIRAQLPVPEVNREINDSSGRFLAQPDLSWPRYRVTFDYEGEHHNTDPVQWDKDIARVPRLESAGYRHLRAAKSAYLDSTEMIGQLAEKLRDGGWDGRSPE